MKTLLKMLLKMSKPERSEAIELHNGLGSYLGAHGFDKELNREPIRTREIQPLVRERSFDFA